MLFRSVRQTWPDLPKELSYPILEISRPDDKESRPFMSYTLNASATPIFIQRFAEDQIKPRLSSVQGIYRIDVSGATPMEWRLEYDSRQLRDLGITIAVKLLTLTNNLIAIDGISMFIKE